MVLVNPAIRKDNQLLSLEFFYFLFYQFFSQQARVGGQNKNKNEIPSDHFPIELKSKETRNCVSSDFNSIGKWSKGFFFLIKMAISHQVLSLRVI